jgi:bifunctional lysine-specific demethylase and histidyl-hydroxylase NO66
VTSVAPEVDLTDEGTRSPLARCTGDPAAFLDATWGRRAALFERAGHGGFDDLLSLDDVDRILSTTSLRTPSFRLIKAGASIPESAYTRSGRTGSKPVAGMADPARVFALFADGATIVLQGLHRYWEPVTRFNRALEVELGHPCQVNAYVTPPSAQGLALHDDPHDVFVLQAFGRKRWEVHAAPGEPDRDPLDAEVAPGDCLYMPKGTPHAASTQETLSGHLTVGVHAATWRDAVHEAVERAERETGLDEPIPGGWTRNPEAFAAQLADRVAALGEALGTVDLEALAESRVERFLTSRAPLLRGALVDQQALDRLDDGTQLARRPGAVCDLRMRDDTVVALLGDRRLTLPGWLEPAMRAIAEGDPFAVGDLAPTIADAQSRAVLCRRLVREGLLRITSER